MLPTRKSDLYISLSFGALIFLIGVFVSPRGFNQGFVDIGHDSYVLKVASDLNGGATLFAQTFTQYGILGDQLNALVLKISNRLLFLKYFYSLIYGVAIATFYLVVREKSGRSASCVVTLFVILSAPFYRHGMMLSVHAPILLLQIIVAAILYRIHQKSSPKLVVLLGAMMALIFLFKQNVGSYQYLLIFPLLALITYRGDENESLFRKIAPTFCYFVASTTAILVPVFVILQSQGSLHDWLVQTVLFPREFYSSYFSNELARGSITIQALNNYPLVPKNLPSVLIQIIDTAIIHPYWVLLRVCLVILALKLFSNQSTRRDGLIMIFFLISGTLTLWPSANFMHQWWTLVPVLTYLPFSLRVSANHKLHNESTNKKVNQLRFKSIIHPSIVPTLGSVVAFAALAVLVFGDRQNILTNNLFSFIINQKRNCVEIIEPAPLSGICTDPKLASDLQRVSEQLMLALSNSQKINKLARAVSINEDDGIDETLISLLPIAALSNNASTQPVFWRLPVLTKFYPDALKINQKNNDVLIELVKGEDSPPSGYETVFELEYEDDVVWRIYAVKK